MDSNWKTIIGVIVAVMLAIAGFGTTWMNRMEDRLLYIGDNYATKTEVSRLDRSMNNTRLEIISMLKNLGDEIRDARKENIKRWQGLDKED